MSSVASQVILHPYVSHFLKVLATTNGRDKLHLKFPSYKTYRALQYFARFFTWVLLRRGYTVEGARWNNLKNSLASGRKLMRIFKPLENLQTALRTLQAIGSPTEQITTIARQLSYFGYLSYDMLVWSHSIRFVAFTPERAAKFNKLSFRFWLSGILFSIANGLLKGNRLATEAKALRNSSEKSLLDDGAKRSRLAAIASERTVNQYQLTIDLLDVWLPATALGLVNLNDGVAGTLGFISSIMALRTQWAAVASK
ncbi:hypothetical protein Clacol_003918 [Clathrus columnatus]|uniref:Peroxisomal biogenesis factor 11 n=1 Tax=Clathrus columnatus TaxID=1419009 RepID=A0AAV5A901_9AGAM|nr:hypothetical protein Clacol_003918 [Clathrus columnatus]